jgi:hypothetical protein
MTTTRTTHDHYTLDEMKNDRDNYLLPRWCQDTKKEKTRRSGRCRANYSSSSVSSSSLAASLSPSSSSSLLAGAREGPMPKVANSVGVNEA